MLQMGGVVNSPSIQDTESHFKKYLTDSGLSWDSKPAVGQELKKVPQGTPDAQYF